MVSKGSGECNSFFVYFEVLADLLKENLDKQKGNGKLMHFLRHFNLRNLIMSKILFATL